MMTRPVLPLLVLLLAISLQGFAQHPHQRDSSRMPFPFPVNDFPPGSPRMNRSFEILDSLARFKRNMRDTTRAQYDSIHSKGTYYSREYNQQRRKRRYQEYLQPHSITTNLTDPLSNRISLTYGYRVSRLIGLELTPAIFFTTPKNYVGGPLIPSPTYYQNCPGMNYAHYRNQGYQLDLTTKFYFPTKPNRYFGIKAFYRRWQYDTLRVMTYYYYDTYANYAVQGEKSNIYGLALVYGWQVTHWDHLNLEFYLGGGAYWRWALTTEYSGGTHFDHIEPVTYPHQHHRLGCFPSLQGGIKIGMRFGKRKIRPV